jgi:hypothetical protein
MGKKIRKGTGQIEMKTLYPERGLSGKAVPNNPCGNRRGTSFSSLQLPIACRGTLETRAPAYDFDTHCVAEGHEDYIL